MQVTAFDCNGARVDLLAGHLEFNFGNAVYGGSTVSVPWPPEVTVDSRIRSKVGLDPMFPALSDDAVTAIVNDMNLRGFGVVTDCVDKKSLQSLRSYIDDAVAAAGGEYVVFTGGENIRHPVLKGLSTSPEFVQACKAVYEKGTGKSAPNMPFYQVLRCLSGAVGLKQSYIFHYDSYVITALVPIIIPTDGGPGDLIMLPNSRTIRKTYFQNLIDKVLLDNTLTQAVLRKLITSRYMKATKIRMVPGNIYFFWGCRSIHANEPCDTDKIRATALFHYVDPYAGSWLRRRLRAK
jgi:hypothetical protein